MEINSVLAERSFIEQWSLIFDDLEFVNGYSKTMRIWVSAPVGADETGSLM